MPEPGGPPPRIGAIAQPAAQIELDGQYRALRDEAGYLERPRAAIKVSGAEAAEYLQGQLTNDVEGLEPDEGAYAALLDRKGHLKADMRVLRLGADELWLDLEPDRGPDVLRHLRTYSVGRELEIADVSDKWEITTLIGPRAGAIAGVEGLGAEDAQRHREWEGVELLAVATDLGLDLITRSGESAALRELLRAAGAVEVSSEAAEILRVESGRPRFGLDMGEALMPAEAGIVERAVDFEKGCYIGQEPVARLHYRGKPNRRLRGLQLSAPAEPGEPLRLAEREVGTVGTSCISPAFGAIALAVLRREASEGDTLAVGDGAVSATVVELPFTPE
jgi:folate-binding protein YgfZ